jgi:large subunit ribosomal protein L25
METVRLPVQERDLTGDGPSRRLRAAGRVPGVLYGKGLEPKSISVALEDLRAALAHGHNVVLELDFGKPVKSARGKSKAVPQYAVVKDIQLHPVKRHPLSIDFHAVDLAHEIEAPVPVELVGTPAGVREGGVVDWEHREVVVRALPGALPEAIPLDVSGLHVGQHLTVAALAAPPGVVILDDPETIVVTLLPPRVEQPGVTAEEAGEPEVVGGSKSEE